MNNTEQDKELKRERLRQRSRTLTAVTNLCVDMMIENRFRPTTVEITEPDHQDDDILDQIMRMFHNNSLRNCTGKVSKRVEGEKIFLDFIPSN